MPSISHRTRHTSRAESSKSRVQIHGLFVLCSLFSVLLLSGCFLVSGATRSADQTADGGNVFVSFVSAEGTETQVVTTSFPSQQLEVTVFAQNRRGQIRIEVLDPQGSVVLSVEGTAQERVAQALVQTDSQGVFRYRVRATGAQRGSFTILYQPAG